MKLFVPWDSFLSWRAFTERAMNSHSLEKYIDVLLVREGFYTLEIHEEGHFKYDHVNKGLISIGSVTPDDKLKYVLFGIVFKKIHST